jgi:hypothetical protein
MNALTRMQSQAGQRKHERFYGARMAIFQTGQAANPPVNPLTDPVPCCHTHLRLDMIQTGAGIHLLSLIETITFRADQCGGNLPAKGTPFTLYPANGAQPLDLQLWDGGILPDGLIYQFVAVDANFKA